jgi:Tol biopolymer transport system component
MNILKRMVYLVSSLAFSALSLLAASPAVHANSFYGGNGRITFYSPVTLDDNGQEIYTSLPDGSDLQQVTDNSLPDANPQWNPDSDVIAFDRKVDDTQGHDIYVQNMNADGTPNGSSTALSGADTTENEWDPSWSPDGTKIAFHRRSTVGGSGPNHIFVIDSAGGSATAVTGGGAGDTDFRDTEATWNKDGDTLVFTRADTADDSTDIATVPSDGTEADVTIIPDSAGGASPQWSPTENRVVFSKGGELWTYKVGDSSSTQLTTGAAIAFAPTYSPDGKIIAASGDDGIEYFNASTGDEITTVTIADNAGLSFTASNGIHEVDWAKASLPGNSTHDCTIYVNETCSDSDFDPQIPDACSTGSLSDITTTAKHGTPSYSSGKFSYKPTKEYVGTDKYVYTYYDDSMNAITCTINITVLPKAPDTGEAPKNYTGTIIGSTLVVGVVSAGSILKKRKFLRR